LSINWSLDVEPRPALLVLPPAAVNLDEAHQAIELWEHYSRKKLDPTQRLTVEVMMALDADDKWAAATTGREMARQNGKGDEVEVVELWGLVKLGEAILHSVHDAALLATQTQERMLRVLESHADLSRLKKKEWKGIGQQMIAMRNGGVIWYRTRTGSGGRGVDDVSRLVVDEAQHATDEQMAAMTPTLLANENPQMNALGTAGIEGKSSWWWSQRKRALSTDPGEFGYVGHTAEVVGLDVNGKVTQEPVDARDRSLWPPANPAVLAGRGGGMAYLEEQFRRLGPAGFAREHLCVWDAPDDDDFAESVVSLDVWDSLADKSMTIETDRQIALDVSPDRKWASFGGAGRRADGRILVEMIDRRPGTDWVVERAVKLWRDWEIPIRIQLRSPAAAFITPLLERRVKIEEMSSGDHAEALGRLLMGIPNDEIRHVGGEALTTAILGAAVRVSGEVELWGRRTSRTDITPLVAVTLALGGVGAIPQFVPLVAYR